MAAPEHEAQEAGGSQDFGVLYQNEDAPAVEWSGIGLIAETQLSDHPGSVELR